MKEYYAYDDTTIFILVQFGRIVMTYESSS